MPKTDSHESKQGSRLIGGLQTIVSLWPMWTLLVAILLFLWGPLRSAANIASDSRVSSLQNTVDSLQVRVKSLETGGRELEKDVALLNVAVAQIGGKISNNEVLYWNDRILKGVWDRELLQKRLFGVSSIIP